MSKWARRYWRDYMKQHDGQYILFSFPATYAIYGIDEYDIDQPEKYREKRLIYIGYTTNLQNRLNQHDFYCDKIGQVHTNFTKETFDDLEIAWRPDQKDFEGATLELKLIRRLKPEGNKRMPKIPDKED